MEKTAPHPSFASIQADVPLLRVAGLRKTFRMGDATIEVLKGVDLDVREGEFLAIEGRSGSGKSTLLHLMGALDQPDSGSVVFDGQELAILRTAARSRIRNQQFGFVFQFYHLLPELSVLENTLLSPMVRYSLVGFRARKADLRGRAVELLTQLGLEHRLKHRPAHLSGGERQRVAIARALMNRPRILFADEPTGNLDVETGQQIMRVFESLHQQHRQTLVMVTHDRALAARADRTLILTGGRLEA
jgi:lipoprotein-releasing system ATP-binding protein